MDRSYPLLMLSMLVSMFVPIALVLAASGKRGREARERARARRMADHQMNARLLRLDLSRLT